MLIIDWYKKTFNTKKEEKKTNKERLMTDAQNCVAIYPQLLTCWTFPEALFVRRVLNDAFYYQKGLITQKAKEQFLDLVDKIPEEYTELYPELFTTILGLTFLAKEIVRRMRTTISRRVTNQFITQHPELLIQYMKYGKNGILITGKLGDWELESEERTPGIIEVTPSLWNVFLPRYAAECIYTFIEKRILHTNLLTLVGEDCPEVQYINKYPHLVATLNTNGMLLAEIKDPGINQRMLKYLLIYKAARNGYAT